MEDKKHINQKADNVQIRPNHPYTFATHWSTQHPSKLLTTPKPSTAFQNPSSTANSPLHRRSDSNSAQKESAFHFSSPHHDLGVSASQDSRRSEDESNFVNSIQSTSIRPPSTQYTPPNVEPTYNSNFKLSLVSQQPPSTAAATSFNSKFVASSTQSYQTERQTTTARSVDKPTRFNLSFGKVTEGTEQKVRGSIKHTNNVGPKSTIGESRILTRPEKTETSSANEHNHLPANDLLPPFQQLHIYDDATTQGPLIYSEWKIPFSGLLPPHPDSNRANKGFVASKDILKSSKQTPKPFSHANRPAYGLEPPRFDAPSTESPLDPSLHNNPFLKTSFVQTTPSFPTNPTTEPILVRRSPTPRSVPTDATTVDANKTKRRDNHYLELKKLLLIPDFTFPLETEKSVRDKYDSSNSLNSFQVRIPDDLQLDAAKTKPWYGENAKCPECHPSLVKPGTCEPCIKFRRWTPGPLWIARNPEILKCNAPYEGDSPKDNVGEINCKYNMSCSWCIQMD